jgi:hypothetical protein
MFPSGATGASWVLRSLNAAPENALRLRVVVVVGARCVYSE